MEKMSTNEKQASRIEQVCFMNMCMICDNAGNVLALDKVNDSYTGTTFPGGHVEKNEIFNDSIIREVWEETGLKIESPKLRGVYLGIGMAFIMYFFSIKQRNFQAS